MFIRLYKGWSAWSTWGDCSRSCGTGARFRTRQCDNPRPAYGGAPCIGEKEEFKFCNIEQCDVRKDFRAEQCRHLFEGMCQQHSKNNIPNNMQR